MLTCLPLPPRGTLAAVGFYTTDLDVPCTISIYKNPASGPVDNTTPAVQFSTTLPDMGYHTVAIPSGLQVPLTTGDKFSVIVNVTNPTNNYFIPTEFNYPGYTSTITSQYGQSYVLGSSGWDDWKNLVDNSHICVKAYTTPLPANAESGGDSGSSGVGGSTSVTVSGIVAGQPATFSFHQNPGRDRTGGTGYGADYLFPEPGYGRCGGRAGQQRRLATRPDGCRVYSDRTGGYQPGYGQRGGNFFFRERAVSCQPRPYSGAGRADAEP